MERTRNRNQTKYFNLVSFTIMSMGKIEDILKKIFEEMECLHSSCANFIDILKSEYASCQGKDKDLINLVNKTVSLLNYIELHQNLNDTRLTKLDFYSALVHNFSSNKNMRKSLVFKVQEGFDGKLKRNLSVEELRHYFTINNCLPMMALVPLQLASNARKYMPADTECEVQLLKTKRTNFITIKNVGPYNNVKELLKIIEEGGRGENSSQVCGMGIGLKQVKDIMDIHKAWLGTEFSVSSGENVFKLNGIPHSHFIVNLCYNSESSNLTDNATLANYTDWNEDLPMIIIHNMFGLTYGLQEIIQESLKYLKKSESRLRVNLLRMIMNKFVDVLRQYLYAISLNNGELEENEDTGEYIDEEINEGSRFTLGNPCDISLHKVSTYTLNNLLCTLYKDKNITCDIQTNQTLSNIVASSAFYSFIVGFLSLILDNVPKNGHLDVTLESDSEDNQIEIYCEQYNLCNFINNNNLSFVTQNRISMYRYMVEKWNGHINCNNNKIILVL